MKYAIHTGYVSSGDGQTHYIGFGSLVRLYGLNPDDCVLWDHSRPETWRGRNESDYIHLHPRADGNYVAPPPLRAQAGGEGKPMASEYINNDGEEFDPTDLTTDDWWEWVCQLKRERDEARTDIEGAYDVGAARVVVERERSRHWQHVAREMEAGMHRGDADLAAQRERSRKLVEALRFLFDHAHADTCSWVLTGKCACDCWRADLRATLAEYEGGQTDGE
jgi:hypothetical protein